MADRKVDRGAVDDQGTLGTTSVGKATTDEDMAASAAASKYNPVLRSKEKSQAQVEAAGGLGAVAAALAKKRKDAAQQATALEGKQ